MFYNKPYDHDTHPASSRLSWFLVTDFRTRSLLREIDRATDNRKEKMDSDELHEYPQRFPAHMLRIELENALEAMLREEILDRERSK